MASEPTLRELAEAAMQSLGGMRSAFENGWDVDAAAIRYRDASDALFARIDALEAAPVHYAAHPCADAAEPWIELIEDTTCVACLRGECERLAAALAAAESEPTGPRVWVALCPCGCGGVEAAALLEEPAIIQEARLDGCRVELRARPIRLTGCLTPQPDAQEGQP